MNTDSQTLNHKIERTRGFVSFVFSILKSIFYGFLVALILNGILWYSNGLEYAIKHLEHVFLSHEHVRYFIVHSQRTNNFLRSIKLHVPNHTVSQIDYYVNSFLLFIQATFLSIVFKFYGVLRMWFLLLSSSIMGTLDGLRDRYIRMAESGRESSFAYHRLSNLALNVPFAFIFFYLSLPIDIAPDLVVFLSSLMFYVFFKLMFGNLKKFL